MDVIFDQLNESGERIGYLFECPGCGGAHYFQTAEQSQGRGPKWTFNGDRAKPTVTPSIRVRGSDYNEATGESRETCCHLFITNGQLRFLGDCTHALAGRTLDMKPEYPSDA